MLLGRVAGISLGVCLLAPAVAGEAASYHLSAAPVASFIWYPSTPRVGEKVSFVSTSSDLTSPIAKFAWDMSDNGPFGAFAPGGPEATGSFATPAAHVVRLRVTNAEGLSSVATETIRMAAAAGLIAPFPIVRIVGSRTRAGVRVRMLAVQAPRDAVISVVCHTPACPRVVRRARATAAGLGSRYLRFRRYARSFHAGAKIEIRVSKAGFVGSYTSFQVRRGHLPRRHDTCLAQGSTRPVACPS